MRGLNRVCERLGSRGSHAMIEDGRSRRVALQIMLGLIDLFDGHWAQAIAAPRVPKMC